MFIRRKQPKPAQDVFDGFDDFGDAASMDEMTGLIPGNNAEETAAEFYDDIYDYLPGHPEKYKS